MMTKTLSSLPQRIDKMDGTKLKLVSKLKNIPDEWYGYCDLKEDPLFGCIPKEAHEEIIKKSFAIAEQAAAELCGREPAEILRAHQVEVRMRNDAMQNTGRIISSQIIYSKEQKVAEFFRDALEEQQRALAEAGVMIENEELLKMHLTHEAYHFLEMSGDRRTGEFLAPVIYKRVLFKRRGTLTSTSEIAAHYFTKLVCNLEYHPKMLDYIWMIQSGKMTEETFFAQRGAWK